MKLVRNIFEFIIWFIIVIMIAMLVMLASAWMRGI